LFSLIKIFSLIKKLKLNEEEAKISKFLFRKTGNLKNEPKEKALLS
jgi:hypothetical protein